MGFGSLILIVVVVEVEVEVEVDSEVRQDRKAKTPEITWHHHLGFTFHRRTSLLSSHLFSSISLSTSLVCI
jgi:hypothetical protein